MKRGRIPSTDILRHKHEKEGRRSERTKLHFGKLRGWPATFFVILVVLALALAAACGDDDDDAAQPAAAAAPEPAPAAQVEPAPAAEPEPAPAVQKTATLRIGAVFPITGGGMAIYGTSEMNGVRLAVEMINAGNPRCVASGHCESGGGFIVGDTLYNIDLIERDSRSDHNVGVTATTELVRDEALKVIFGPLPHGTGLAAQEITQPAEVLHLMALSILNSPDGVLTPESAGPGGDKHWLFQTEPAEVVRSTITAAGILELLGAQPGDLSMVLATDDPSGKFLGLFYNDVLEALGQETREVVFYPPGTTDFSPFLTRIKAEEPDYMHNWYIVVDSVLISAQSLELEVAQKGYMVFGADPGWWAENATTDNDVPVTIACINVCRGDPGGFDPEVAAGHYDRVNQFECPPAGICDPAPIADITLWTHDYVFMLTEAMQTAGTVDDTTAIADALEKVEYDGVLGPLTFDATHGVAHGYDSCLILSGEITCKHFSNAEYGPEATGVNFDSTGAVILD